jgi:FMN reductase
MQDLRRLRDRVQWLRLLHDAITVRLLSVALPYAPLNTRQAVAHIAIADAVLIAAPVYRASYPGVLKNLLDNTPVEALQNKPVAILAMGGSPHHYLAIDNQLRPVLAWFGALVLPTSVYLTGADFRDGQLASGAGRGEMQSLLSTMLLLAGSLQRATLGPPPLAARFS